MSIGARKRTTSKPVASTSTSTSYSCAVAGDDRVRADRRRAVGSSVMSSRVSVRNQPLSISIRLPNGG